MQTQLITTSSSSSSSSLSSIHRQDCTNHASSRKLCKKYQCASPQLSERRAGLDESLAPDNSTSSYKKLVEPLSRSEAANNNEDICNDNNDFNSSSASFLLLILRKLRIPPDIALNFNHPGSSDSYSSKLLSSKNLDSQLLKRVPELISCGSE